MVVDLSLTGCAIKTIQFVRTGAQVELRILMSDHDTPLVVGLAKVRWGVVGKFGVEFIRVPGEDLKRLGRLAKSHLFRLSWVTYK